MNFLLPLLVGGPDMAKGLAPARYDLYATRRKILRTCTFNSSSIRSISSSTSSIEPNSNKLGSYLAGLFEGDGHI